MVVNDAVALLLKVVSVVSLVCVSMGVCSCSSFSLVTRTVNEEDSRYVRLQARYGQGQDEKTIKFAHPKGLNETEWDHLLSHIYVQQQKTFLSFGTPQPAPTLAFGEHERQYLAKYLAEGFDQARPDEWVVFYLGHPREPSLVEIDSGGLFIEDGQLHLVIANYHQPVSMAFIQRQIMNDPLRPAGDSFYDVILKPHQTVRTVRRRDLTQSLLKQVSELIIDYGAVLDPTSEPSLTKGTFQLETEIGGGTKRERSGLEERLRILNRLCEQGLITEEEFRSKRARLLERL